MALAPEAAAAAAARRHTSRQTGSPEIWISLFLIFAGNCHSSGRPGAELAVVPAVGVAAGFAVSRSCVG